MGPRYVRETKRIIGARFDPQTDKEIGSYAYTIRGIAKHK
jgi:hypothetical protein